MPRIDFVIDRGVPRALGQLFRLTLWNKILMSFGDRTGRIGSGLLGIRRMDAQQAYAILETGTKEGCP